MNSNQCVISFYDCNKSVLHQII